MHHAIRITSALRNLASRRPLRYVRALAGRTTFALNQCFAHDTSRVVRTAFLICAICTAAQNGHWADT